MQCQSKLRLPHLQTLTLFNSATVTDIGMAACLENVGGTLENLDFPSCTQIGNGTLRAVALLCPRLRSLNMTRCAINDAGILEFAAAGTPRGGEALWQEVSPRDAMAHPQQHFNHHHDPLLPVEEPQLRNVNFSCCPQLTDQGVIALKSRPYLISINVGYNPNVSHLSLKSLLDEPGTQLSVLFAVGCRRLQFEKDDLERWVTEEKIVCTGLR